MTIARRIARGLRFEAKRSHRGVARAHAYVARKLGLRPVDLIGLLNPMRKRKPARAVRRALELVSARWPDGRIHATRDWGQS